MSKDRCTGPPLFLLSPPRHSPNLFQFDIHKLHPFSLKSIDLGCKWNGNSQKKYDGTAPVRNTCENLASQTWPNWGMHVAKLGDAGQEAPVKLCLKKIFIEMA